MMLNNASLIIPESRKEWIAQTIGSGTLLELIFQADWNLDGVP